MPLDQADKNILNAIQSNSGLTAADLSQKLNMSASQAGRRRQRLEAAGYITHYGAHLDAQKMGLHVQGFVQVQMAAHSEITAKSFARLIKLRPEIVNAWVLTGQADYLLHIYCTDLAALNSFIQGILLPHDAVARVESQIVMDALKTNAPLPI